MFHLRELEYGIEVPAVPIFNTVWTLDGIGFFDFDESHVVDCFLHQDRENAGATESNCRWTLHRPPRFSKWISLGKRLDRARKVSLPFNHF